MKKFKIIEKDQFRHELSELRKSCERIDDFANGTKWILERKPDSGRKLDNGPVWSITTSELSPLLPIAIYYTFGKSVVVLMSIRLIGTNGHN